MLAYTLQSTRSVCTDKRIRVRGRQEGGGQESLVHARACAYILLPTELSAGVCRRTQSPPALSRLGKKRFSFSFFFLSFFH